VLLPQCPIPSQAQAPSALRHSTFHINLSFPQEGSNESSTGNTGSYFVEPSGLGANREQVPISDLNVFVPCVNNGRGENVNFAASLGTIFYYVVTNGQENGFFMWVGTLNGTGATTGIKYSATGSTQMSFNNFVPKNPDGSADGDGIFSYTDN
jgi:hypothetical protein